MGNTNADFSQNDPRWGSHLLGFSTWEKIGPFGCLITAAANVITAQGDQMTPLDVDTALKVHGYYKRDEYGQVADVAGYGVLGQIAPHTHFVEQQNWPGTVVAPAAYFDVRSSVATEVIIGIDDHPEEAGIQWHFVRVIGLTPARNDIEIVDSWDGKRKLLSVYSSRGNKNPFQIIWSAGKYHQV